MARSHRSLARLRRHLAEAGFETWARSYPSRRMPIQELAELVAGWIRVDLGKKPIAGVTHSMGGILARHMTHRINWRKLVMIAPPNAGSRIAERLGDRPLFRWFYGPSGQELADDSDWPDPPRPFAVIAGTRSLALSNPTSWLTSGLGVFPDDEPNDGTVAASETRMPGMSDYAEVDATHTWIMSHPKTLRLVVNFLETGRFR